MEYPNFIVSYQNEEYIRILRVTNKPAFVFGLFGLICTVEEFSFE